MADIADAAAAVAVASLYVVVNVAWAQRSCACDLAQKSGGCDLQELTEVGAVEDQCIAGDASYLVQVQRRAQQ